MEADPYTGDYTDEISELVEEVHAIFNATTVSEVMDMRDRQSQEDFLNKILIIQNQRILTAILTW